MKNILIVIFVTNLSINLFCENQIRFDENIVEVIEGKSYILGHLENHYASKDDIIQESANNTSVSSKAISGTQPKFSQSYKNDEDFIKYYYKNPKFIFSNVSYRDFEQYGKDYEKVPYQLPEEILGSLTTEELILYCCDHPSLKFASIRTCAKTKLAIERDKPESLSQFNGFHELLRRNNYLEDILNLFENCYIEDFRRQKTFKDCFVKGNTYKDHGDLSILASTLFSLLSSKSIYNSISEQDRVNVTLSIKKLYESIPYSSPVEFYAFLVNYYYEQKNVWRSYFSYSSPISISIKQDLIKVFDKLIRGVQ